MTSRVLIIGNMKQLANPYEVILGRSDLQLFAGLCLGTPAK
jgi:hypothetical protein